MQRRRGDHRARRGDPRVSRAVEAQARRPGHRRGRGAGPEHHPRDQPVLPWPVEFQRFRMGPSLRLAGAHHARRSDRMASLGARLAARRTGADGVSRGSHLKPTRADTGSLPRFVVRVVAWLPLTFAVWYLAAPLLAWPVALLAELVTRSAFDWIKGVEQTGPLITFITSLKPAGSANPAGVKAVVSVESNVL